jgi:hypothetical protein
LYERTGNVYENKGQGRRIEKPRNRGSNTTASFGGTLGVALFAPRLFDSQLLDFQDWTNEAGMLLKTKGRYGRPASEAGMFMKTQAVSYQ